MLVSFAAGYSYTIDSNHMNSRQDGGVILMGVLYLSINIFSFLEGIDTFQAILFIIGLLLLVVEMFIPGFGFAGGTGLVLLILGIILTAVRSTYLGLPR